MKKLITYFLIFALSLTSAPISVFAQDAGVEPVMYFKDKKGRIQEYKPAMSFKYDNYEVGQISPYTFVEKLEQDLLNGEDYWDPNSKPRLGDDKLGTPEHIAQSYNDFLYYNIHPKESPLWNYTALVPGNGTSQVDVLRILDYHLVNSKEISELFEQNPEYQEEKKQKRRRDNVITGILIVTFYISWEVAPEIVTGLIPYLSKTTKAAKVLKAITSFATMIAFDAYITEQIAWWLKHYNKNTTYLYQSVDSYASSTIKILNSEADWLHPYKRLTNKPDGTDLLKSTVDTEIENIENQLKKMYPRSKWLDPLASPDAQLLKYYFKYGYRSIDDMYKPRLKQILGKFLYDLFDGDEVLIDEYVRKEMLRTYYALEFIRDELSNTDDPLRYERAGIDLATTYKVQTIQISDGRMVNNSNIPKRSVIEEHITTPELISVLNLILKKDYVSQELLEEHLGSSLKAKVMLITLEKRKLITEQNNGTWAIDHEAIKLQLKELKDLSKPQPKIMSYGQNLQQIKGTHNLGKYENRDFLGYINAEIERQLGSQLDDKTSVMITYPTMLTRAQVNYLVQLMDIPKKKRAHDELVKKQRKKHVQTLEEIKKKVLKRVDENLETPNWSMNK